MIKSHKNGKEIYWNKDTEEWLYSDGSSLSFKTYPCPRCGEMPTKEGHDFCLANLPGVLNACCGHGKERGYIHFEDGRTIRFHLEKVEHSRI